MSECYSAEMMRKPLSETHPELASEAHGWDPNTLTAGSSLKKDWKCKLGHIWESRVADRSKGQGCPVCSGHKVLSGLNDLASKHPKIAKEADGWDPKTVTARSGKKMAWKCKLGHKWEAAVNSRTTRNFNCPYCSNQSVLVGYNDFATTHPELLCELINSNGKFTLRFIIGDIIHVYIEQLICEYTYKKDDLGDPSKEDLENHEIEKARQDYTDYIRETLSTLEEVRDKIDQSIIDKVLWASEVSNVKEITKEEFELAQKEIEDWLNPILASTSRFASASTASANHT